MLAASAVDAMLKEKNYSSGTLNARINQARDDHLITAGMADWAHAIRLDANAQRHADDSEPLPNEDDARRILDFSEALAQFLYVLPALVEHGTSTNDSEGPSPS